MVDTEDRFQALMQMAHFRLHLGGWNICMGACSPDVDALTNQVAHSFDSLNIESSWDDSEREGSYLTVCTPKILEQPEVPQWLPEREHNAWQMFLESLKSHARQIRRGSPSGAPVYLWPQLGTNNNIHDENMQFPNQCPRRFFAFVMDVPDEYCKLELMLHILFLANQWHVEHGGLFVHSSAVVNGENGFIFLGPSTAGKTTVANLSKLIGHSALGDDLNFIYFDDQKDFRVAPGPTLSGARRDYSPQRPLLRGIFKLVQDEQDFLTPITSRQVAQQLFIGLGQVPYYSDLSEQNIKDSFGTCCVIARDIPGYELHFRNSSDFWYVINEQFPK